MADDVHTPDSSSKEEAARLAKKEYARLYNARRRAALSPEDLERERERARARYHASKKPLTAEQRAVHAARAKQWREANPERYKAAKKAATGKNKEKYHLKIKEWLAANREKHLDWRRARYKDKLAPDPRLRIERALRARLAKALKTRGAHKSAPTLSLIGCSVEELRLHIERQFKRGMNWSNYGEWVIDHIIPCASFDLTKEEEQKRCFHFTNLRPLEKRENQQKHARITVLL